MITKTKIISVVAIIILTIGMVIHMKPAVLLIRNLNQQAFADMQPMPSAAIKTQKIQEPFSISVVNIDTQYATDFSDDEVLVGASHNVFIGKVVRQIGDKERGIGPETQFEVEVIDNIKGELKGNITVDQLGGNKNGTLYVVDDDIESSTKGADGYLLQPGSIYLLATRYNVDQNWYTLNPYPTASKLLSSDLSASDANLEAIIENDPRVQQLKAAYPNEILLDADVAHNNTLNSYISVQAAKEHQAEVSSATSTEELSDPIESSPVSTTEVIATSTEDNIQSTSTSLSN